MKKYILVLGLVLSIGIFAGCTKDDSIVSDTINTLTSDKYEGRAIGTKGNELAETYIVDKLTSLNIDKYNGSYLHSFEGSSYIPSEQSLSMKLLFNEGSEVKELIYGEDFLVNRAVDLKGEYTLSSTITNEENKISMLKDISEISNQRLGDISIVKEDDLNNASLSEEFSKTIIFVKEEMYNLCTSNLEGKIQLDFSFKESNVSMNNVIGKIKGKDSSKAIIISSHLDHVGAIGDNIWRGALDNASGVASTLYIAEYLKGNFKSPQYDIVFIFFNGEETNLLGSNYLVPNIKKDYDKMLNINIDCIGMKASDTVLVTSNDEEFKSEAVNYFTSQNINAEGEKNPIGDGGIFHVNGIPAITLIDKGYEGNIHILEDTPERISFSLIEEISKACGQFIIEQGDKLLENLSKGDTDVSLDQSIDYNDLNQWEYTFEETGDHLATVDKASLYMDKTNFETEKKYLSEELLNKLNLKFELNSYTVSHSISFNYFNEITNPEVGEVYSFIPTENNFTYLESSFLNSANEQLPRVFTGKLFKFSKDLEYDVNSYNAFLENPLTMDYEKRSGSLEKIAVNGKEAQILYAANSETHPIGIVFFIEGEKNFYTIYICDDEFRSSFFKDKDDLMNLINSTEILSWYEEIISNLEK